MATLRREDGTILTEPSALSRTLAPLRVTLETWPVPGEPQVQALLALDDPSPAERERLLAAFEPVFERLKKERGYQARDLIVLHPALSGLDELLGKFDRCHRHDDEEVRYIVEGEGVFGFVLPDASQVELQVLAGDYINVPAHTEHWFRLGAGRRIKALRYFVDTTGWVPRYTGTPIRFPA